MRAEELEEVGDGHVDRDGEHAELGRALLREDVVVLEDAHLCVRCGRPPQELSQQCLGAGECQRQKMLIGQSVCAPTCPLNFCIAGFPV